MKNEKLEVEYCGYFSYVGLIMLCLVFEKLEICNL